MSLNNFYFPIFFCGVIVFLAVLQLAGKIFNRNLSHIQILFLLLASYIFLGLSDILFCVILFTVTLATHFLAIIISGKKQSKFWTCFGIAILLAALAYFKYMNFFVVSFSKILGIDSPSLNIILPLGISFYTFTAIAYLVDVYKGKIAAEKNFILTALFLSFFPKLISGPITRADDFIPQLKKYNGLTFKNFKVGIQVFAFGLFKKIVLADHLGVFTNDVFRTPTAFNSGTVILAAISYSLQIYFDFSGYSDMAIGTAKILGIELKPNFNMPYLSANPQEFWRRWHISLSEWFRDYLYFPLGGSRKSAGRTYLNLLIVMLASGLWHGAGWTFIAWGGLHGIFSCAGKFISSMTKQKSAVSTPTIKTKIFQLLKIATTFFIVTLLWIFFRAENFTKAFQTLKACFIFQKGISQPYTWSFFAIVIFLVSSIAAKIKSGKKSADGFYPILDLSHPIQLSMFFVFIGITIILGYYGDTAFIYGKF